MIKGKVTVDMFNDLNKKLDLLTDTVAVLVKPENESQGPQVEYSDPIVQACEKAQVSAIESMPEGDIILKGRRGTQHINRSQLKLDAIKNFLQDRNQYGAVRNIR
tara:strand:+ start:3785 stop:4099 length:315 start_codon:yes stop_codon:yes gene_type:complete